MVFDKKNYLSIAFILIVVIVFFYKTFFYNLLPIPADALVGLYHPFRDYFAKEYPNGIPFKNFLITDPVRQQIPWRKLSVDYIKEARFPSLNPFNFSGIPLASNIQTAVFYPLNILFLVFSFQSAWTILIILQPILAGIFLYLYLQNKGFDNAICIFGSIVWSFCGFNIAWLTWGTVYHVSLWLPLILMSIDKLVLLVKAKSLKKEIIWMLILTLSYIFAFFAGHAQVAFYIVAFSIFYFLYQITVNKFAKDIQKRLFFVMGLSLLIFVIISSVQWMPMLKLSALSSRFSLSESLWENPGWFMPVINLIQFIAPDFFGNPTTLNYWGEWNYGEFIGYIGILPLIFAAVAILNIKKQKDIQFWLGVIVFGFIFMLPSFVSKLPYITRLPYLSSLQPTRLMILIDFSFVMLAVYGFRIVMTRKNNKSLIAFSIIFSLISVPWVVLLIFINKSQDPLITSNLNVSKRNLILPTALLVFSGILLFIKNNKILPKYNKKIFISLIMGVVIFDLFRFGWKFIPFTSADYFYPETKAINFLQSIEKPYRIISIDKRLMPANVNAFYGIEDAGGYDSLYSSRYEEFIASLNRGVPNISPPFGFNRIVTVENLNSPLLPLLNAKYILSLNKIESSDYNLIFEEGITKIYQYAQALPRIYLASQAVSMFGKEDIIAKLYEYGFDLGLTALVENAKSIDFQTPRPDEYIEIVKYTQKEIEAKISTSSERLLVILNSYNKGWNATVDNKQVFINRVNYAFQGVYLPKGNHTLKMIYHIY